MMVTLPVRRLYRWLQSGLLLRTRGQNRFRIATDDVKWLIIAFLPVAKLSNACATLHINHASIYDKTLNSFSFLNNKIYHKLNAQQHTIYAKRI